MDENIIDEKEVEEELLFRKNEDKCPIHCWVLGEEATEVEQNKGCCGDCC